MKKSVIFIITGLILAVISVNAQTLTDVINEYNAGAESLNGQSYETALTQFNNCLALCDVVGDEASEMKVKAQTQVIKANYGQAIALMKRKQYDKALPFLENTVNYSQEYGVEEEMATKAEKYLPPLYLREGNVLMKQEKFDEADAIFDKVISMDPEDYKAHQGKGLVYKEEGNIDAMLEEFNIAKEKAAQKNDTDFIAEINTAINDHFNSQIQEEEMMMDTEEPDYTFLLDICDQALAANPENGLACWKAAEAYNKNIEYDSAIEYAKKGLAFEKDPTLVSALYYELGQAYQGNVMYVEACEAYNKVTEEPFFTKAEKKLMTPQLGCTN